MVPLQCLEKELDEKYVKIVAEFVINVRTGKVKGSNSIAVATITMVEKIINDLQEATAVELFDVVCKVGQQLQRALPHHLVAGNVVRRVLRALRDEHSSAHQNGGGAESAAGSSLQRVVRAAPAAPLAEPPPERPHRSRDLLRDHIAEIHTELETSEDAICSSAREHVRADELILTYGASSLAERVLRKSLRQHYRLVMVEDANVKESHAMAARLGAAGVPVAVVSAAAVFSVMSRVNKVVVGVRAVLADGGVLGAPGLGTVTTAAKHYNVPVIALAALHEVCALHACDRHRIHALSAPHHALPYRSSAGAGGVRVRAVAPACDVLPPDHVTLFVTNLGGSSPTYMYRLLTELYHPDDYHL